MYLIVDELRSSLYQEVTTPRFVQDQYAVRAHLYNHLSPSGSLYVEVRTTGDVLVATSETITIASIGTAVTTLGYDHGDVRFLITTQLLPSTTYRIYLKSTGYTYASGSFIGWCRDYDLRRLGLGYAPASDEDTPFLCDFFAYQYQLKGA